MITPFIGGNLISKNQLNRFNIGIIILGIIISFIGIYQGKTLPNGRWVITQSVSPLFSYSLSFSAIIAIVSALDKKIIIKIFSYIYVGIAFYIILSSGSRGPLVAFVGGFILIIISGSSLRKKITYILVGSILIFIGVQIFKYIPESSMVRFESTINLFLNFNNQNINSEIFSRLYIWEEAINVWIANPLFGIGIGNFSIVAPDIITVHNFILETMVEMGFVGLVLFILFFIYVIKKLFIMNSDHKNETFYKVILSLFIMSIIKMSFSGQVQTALEFWLISGVIIGIPNNDSFDAPESNTGDI